jgi:hypothetical protein
MTRNRVTEIVHIKVERWKRGARKPTLDSIMVRRVRSNTEPPETSIEEMARRLLGPPPEEPKSLPPGPKKKG